MGGKNTLSSSYINAKCYYLQTKHWSSTPHCARSPLFSHCSILSQTHGYQSAPRNHSSGESHCSPQPHTTSTVCPNPPNRCAYQWDASLVLPTPTWFPARRTLSFEPIPAILSGNPTSTDKSAATAVTTVFHSRTWLCLQGDWTFAKRRRSGTCPGHQSCHPTTALYRALLLPLPCQSPRIWAAWSWTQALAAPSSSAPTRRSGRTRTRPCPHLGRPPRGSWLWRRTRWAEECLSEGGPTASLAKWNRRTGWRASLESATSNGLCGSWRYVGQIHLRFQELWTSEERGRGEYGSGRGVPERTNHEMENRAATNPGFSWVNFPAQVAATVNGYVGGNRQQILEWKYR